MRTLKCGIFVDNSGSTSNVWHYHKRVIEVLTGRETAACFYWNSDCREVSYDTIVANSSGRMSATGGTEISSIWQHLAHHDLHCETLVIITDGEVSSRSVTQVHEAVRQHGVRWGRTEAHIVSSRPNTSVVAPFIQGVPYAVFDSVTEPAADGARMPVSTCNLRPNEAIEKMKQVNTEAELAACFEELHARIAADTIIGADIATREAVLAMRKRVVASSAMQATPVGSGPISEDEVAAIARDFYADGGVELSSADRLLRLCDSIGSFSLDRLRVQREARVMKEAPASTLTEIEAESCDDYIDPVCMDEDMPVALFSLCDVPVVPSDDPFREEVQRSPLKLLCSSRHVAALQARVQPPHGLNMLKALRAHSEFRSPETRELLMREVLVFGDHPTHVKANKACIARLLFGGTKLCGQYGLWLVVLWWAMRQKAYVADAMGPQMDRFMADFLVNTPKKYQVYMGMSGDGQRPTALVPIAKALLYAVHSTRLWATSPERDIMRDLFNAYGPIRDALGLCGVDVSSYDSRIALMATSGRLLGDIKRLGHDVVMKRLCRRFAGVLALEPAPEGADENKDFVLLDYVAKAPSADTALEYTLVKQKVVHAGLKFSAVMLDENMQVLDPVADMQLGENYSKMENDMNDTPSVRLSPRTLRPFTTVSGRPWEDLSVEAYGPLDQQCSIYKWLCNFYIQHNRFPVEGNAADEALFMRMLQQGYSHKGCLPVSIRQTYVDAVRAMAGALELRATLHPDLCTVKAIRTDIHVGATRARRAEMEGPLV